MGIKQFLHDHSEFSDNPMFILRPMKEKDKQAYMHLLSENALVDESPMGKEIREEMWLNRINKNTVTYSIRSPQNGEFMGYCQYKNLSTSKPDIGIEILPQFQHQGLGYAVCSTLIRTFFEKTSFPEIYYKVERKNTASITLIEKLGGIRDTVNHTHEQLLSILNTLSVEELAEQARNAPALIASLEKYSAELLEEELPTDILIYRIKRDAWL